MNIWSSYSINFFVSTILDITSSRGLQIRDTVCPAREDMASTTTWAASIQEVVKVWVESLMARRIRRREKLALAQKLRIQVDQSKIPILLELT